ncbi:hypothetical protein A2U01_0108065, partial [Trifolium medium]|nr:hypothetical protein [Trifolium medium]
MYVRRAIIFPLLQLKLHAIQGKLSLLFSNYSSMASPSKSNVGSGPKNTE